LGDTPPIIRSSKTEIAASCFTYFFVAGCCDGSAITAASNKKYVNPEDAITVFELLIMGGVLPETC
jgi:hypothetical protein